MKILHVINVRWFNATAWYALQLAKLQRLHGHEVCIITIPGTDTDIKAQSLGFTPLYINLTSNNPFTISKSFFQLVRFIQEFNPDCINCHRGESFLFFALLRSFFSFALIRTRGDQRLPKKNWINQYIHKYHTDAIISTNTKMTHALEERFHLPHNSVHTIIGGVDTKQFQYSTEGRNRIRKQYGFHEHDCVLGVLGRLDWVKGQKELIEAIRIIKQQGYKHIKVLLIGFTAGIEEDQVQQWIDEAHLSDIVYITGKCQFVHNYLSALDIALICSLGSETIARAALEILSCQLPLLSTNVGVMPDLLPQDLLIQLPPNDDKTAIVSCFVRAIIDTVTHQEYREKLQKAGEKTLPFITEEHFYTLTNAVYTQAIQQRRE